MTRNVVAGFSPRFHNLTLAALLILALSLSAHAQVQVGYSVITSDAGSRAPAGTASFSFTNADGVLVSQAGVGASAPIRSGEIFVDESGTKTSIALVNIFSAIQHDQFCCPQPVCAGNGARKCDPADRTADI
jgi:hypothetical protein